MRGFAVVALAFSEPVLALRHPGAVLSRRAAVLSAAAAPWALWRDAAEAGTDAFDRESIIKRAQEKSLSVDRVVARAQKGELFDGKGASCEVIDRVLGVDRIALQDEQRQLESLKKSGKDVGKYGNSLADIEKINKKIDKQIKALAALEEKNGCLDAFVTYDKEAIIERARKQSLDADRVVQRAETDKLIQVEGMSCDAMSALIVVDEEALTKESVRLTKLKKALKNSADAEAIKTQESIFEITLIQNKIEKQIGLLQASEMASGCQGTQAATL